jgi:cob(I)alamin adenosyltransferase
MKIYTKTGDGGESSLYNGERLPKDCDFFCALGDVDELNSAIGVARQYCLESNPATAAQASCLTKGSWAGLGLNVSFVLGRGHLKSLGPRTLNPEPLNARTQLEVVQSRLLDAGSAVATPSTTSSEAKLQRTRFEPAITAQLEVGDWMGREGREGKAWIRDRGEVWGEIRGEGGVGLSVSLSVSLTRTHTHTHIVQVWIDEMDSQLPPLSQFILPSGGQGSSFLHMARSICRRAERSVVPLSRAGHVDDAVSEGLMDRWVDGWEHTFESH